MMAVRRLQSLLRSRAFLCESAACTPQQEATRYGENVWLLGPEGACGCFWEGVETESTAESATKVHSASKERDFLPFGVEDSAADSKCQNAFSGGYSTSVYRSHRPQSVHSGYLRGQTRPPDLGKTIKHTFTHACLQSTPPAKVCALTNSSQCRNLITNAHSSRHHRIPSVSPQLRISLSQHRLLGSQHRLSFGVFSRAFADSSAEAADVLVEHLGSDGSDHPTDADLDRALGEPTSKSSASDIVKGATPKVSIEATKLFNRVWNQVVIKMGGIESLNIPKEIVWLNGAPGSGKGANTPFILQTRGFPTKAISISSLLQDDKAAQEIMKSGALLSDSHVLELVLEGILKMGFVDSPDEEGDEIPDEDEIIAGVVVDGFPRTTMQVDFVKLLHDKLADLHYQHLSSPQEHHFPRPIFRIAVLYVEEEESVRRQLHRGRAALAHNQRVRESGLGELVEVRETDLDEKAARRRYQIFREHYDTLLRLKSFFPFHLIDAMGTLAQCREQIAEELQYQSGLELGEDTFRAICHLPLAKNLVKQARQNMVTRLDSYMKHDLDTFKKVIDIVEHEVIPIVRRCALAGVALYNTERPFFLEHPEASEMLADVLSERGYYVTWQTRTREIPVKVDLATGKITCEKRVSLQFRIKFDRPIIRNPVLYPSAEEKS